MNKIKGIECKPIRPSYSIKLQYAKDLSVILTNYWNGLVKLAVESYSENIAFDSMAFDVNIPNLLDKYFSEKALRLKKVYNPVFKKLPNFYINKVDKKTTYDLKNSITSAIPEDLQFVVVNFSKEAKQALIAKDAVIKSNVDLITGINEEMQGQIHEALLDALKRGRDIDYLKDELSKIHSAKFSEKRIKLIARDQIDKATQVIDHARRADLGLTQSIWKHSKISKEPRKSHLQANNTVYDIDKGCKIDGEYIYPAQKYGCNCYSAPFIPWNQ
jgi:uncharacterized protein with gpF-like domain